MKNNCCINPRKENDDKCFKWAVTVALHHEEIEKELYSVYRRLDHISKDTTGVVLNFLHRATTGRNLRNRILIALNVFIIEGDKKIRQGHISKYNIEMSASNC